MTDPNVPKTYTIYKLTCKTTKLSYIGMTSNFARRKGEHGNDSSSKKLRAAIELFGPDDFEWFVMDEIVGKRDALNVERKLISELNTAWPNGYNVMAGEGSLSKVASPESKARRRAAQLKLWERPEHREIISKRSKDYWAIEENRQTLVNRMTERWKDPAFREMQRLNHWSNFKRREISAVIQAKALEREELKKEKGIATDYTYLVESTKRAWKDPVKKAARLENIKAYWNSEEGNKQKEINRQLRAERNREMWKDPEFVKAFEKANINKTVSEATRQKQSVAAKARRAREKTAMEEGLRNTDAIIS